MTNPHHHIKTLDHTIDLLSIHRLNSEKYPYLVESVAKCETNARYDILFAFPQAALWLDAQNKIHTSNISLDGQNISEAFDNWFEAEKITEYSDLPFSGGWFVFLAYEFAQEVEPVLDLPLDTENILPVAFFSRIPAAIVCDHQLQKTYLVAEGKFSHLVDDMFADVREISDVSPSLKSQIKLVEEEPSRYINAVEKIKKYIVEGDVFQVNLSRVWNAYLSQFVKPADLYHSLRKANPAPFAGLAVFENSAVISSSPERLVKVEKGIIETRPIAGTRPRVRNARGDLDDKANDILQKELLAHPKERAEHVMLIDLERNDLGRVCLPGTVEVNELMVLESYEHVHHIVSNVRGRQKPEMSPMDIIKATFPGGTITGCPKVRCMEIIAELEEAPRMAYTGSMGYINRSGDMDLNILIRTIIQQKEQLIIRAGAGIVADSEPEKELQETRIKARGMLNAL